MKKIISLLLGITLILFCFSCGNHTEIKDTSAATEVHTEPITEEETTGVLPIVPTEKKGGIYYPHNNIFTESKTRVVFVNEGMLYYYNKIDNQKRIFCFDPLCEHYGNPTCVADKFMLADMGVQTIAYCDADDRFYALRGKQFYSFDHDGKDFRTEYTFGEEGKIKNGSYQRAYSTTGLGELSVKGNYVYMIATDRENGKNNLMQFDVNKRKIIKLHHSTEDNLMGYLLGDGCLYVKLVGEKSPGIYQMTMDGKLQKKLSDNLMLDFYTGICDGKSIYMFDCIEKDGQWGPVSVPQNIVAYRIADNTVETIYRSETPNAMRLLAVTDEKVYFTKEEPIAADSSDDENINLYSKIYALDKKTHTVDTVLNDLRYSTKSLYFYEDKILLDCMTYTNGKSRISVEILNVDDEGKFAADEEYRVNNT